MTKTQIKFTFEALPEETPIRGNASCIDPETDRETEEMIESQLEEGNEWAWCTVKCTARLGDFVGVAYLGCCSFKSLSDFIDFYGKSVQDEAVEDLKEKLETSIKTGNAAKQALRLVGK
jgi:hypothetical protein